MLETGKKVLVLTKDKELVERYYELSGICGFELEARDSWNSSYRINHDVIVADTDFIQCVSSLYRDKVVALFSGKTTDMFSLADRFIFDRENLSELMYSVMKIEVDMRVKSTKSLIIKKACNGLFQKGDYDFNFETNTYLYKGSPIHLSNGQATALANWLLLGVKDNNCCVQLYQMRRTLGKDFLADINKYGEVK